MNHCKIERGSHSTVHIDICLVILCHSFHTNEITPKQTLFLISVSPIIPWFGTNKSTKIPHFEILFSTLEMRFTGRFDKKCFYHLHNNHFWEHLQLWDSSLPQYKKILSFYSPATLKHKKSKSYFSPHVNTILWHIYMWETQASDVISQSRTDNPVAVLKDHCRLFSRTN